MSQQVEESLAVNGAFFGWGERGDKRRCVPGGLHVIRIIMYRKCLVHEQTNNDKKVLSYAVHFQHGYRGKGKVE